MSEVNTEKHLITIESAKALEVFTTPKKLDALMNEVKKQTLDLVFDINTPTGRKDIASVAYRIARTKTYLDDIGKDLVSEYKELPKRIDAGRKLARDTLDALKEQVRKPLDEWEAEQEILKNQLDAFNKWDEALEMNRVFIEAKAQQAHRMEVERLQREEDIKRKAIIETEAKAQLELEKQQKAHERELVLKELEKLEAINAEKQRAKEELAKANLLKEIEAQKIKLNADLEENRKQDEAHRLRIKESIIIDLMMKLSMDSITAEKLVDAINQNLIKYLKIEY